MIKMTFGLQPNQIKIIEDTLKEWNKPWEYKGEMISSQMKYSTAFWEVVAKEVGWCPFTLALKYLEYKSK